MAESPIMSLEEINELRQSMLVQIERLDKMAKAMEEDRKASEVETPDDDYYFDEDEEMDKYLEMEKQKYQYTDEEKNGDFERYTPEEISDICEDLKKEVEEGIDQTTEEQVKQSEAIREKELAEKMNELRAKQRELRKINRSIFIKEQRERLAEACEKLKQGIIDTVKMYNAKAQKCAEDYITESNGKKSIIEEYKKAVEQMDAVWQKGRKELADELAGLQVAEQKQMAMKSEYVNQKKMAVQKKEARKVELLKEVNEAMKTDDVNRMSEITKELNELKRNVAKYDEPIYEETSKLTKIQNDIAECKKRLDEYDEAANKQLEEKKADKDEKISRVVKQNILQKAVGFIVSKFNGAKAFTKNVIEKIQDKISRIIEEDVPEAEQKLEQLSEEREAREERYDEEYWSEQVSEIVEEESSKIEVIEKDPKKSREEKIAEKEAAREEKRAEREAVREEKRKARYEAAMQRLQDRIAQADSSIKAAQERFQGKPLEIG